MYLYKSYCYQDIESVIASFQSRVILDGFGLIQEINQISPGVLSVDYQIADGSINTVTIELQTCERPGFDNSFTGISVEDAVELSGLILVVLAAAYSFKLLRRSL